MAINIKFLQNKINTLKKSVKSINTSIKKFKGGKASKKASSKKTTKKASGKKSSGKKRKSLIDIGASRPRVTGQSGMSQNMDASKTLASSMAQNRSMAQGLAQSLARGMGQSLA
jgi:hypothetical protein